MAIQVYSEKDLRNQELLKSLASGASAQSGAIKSQLNSQWTENRQGIENNLFVQDFSGANLFSIDNLNGGSWYSIGKLVFLDIRFTYPNNSNTNTALFGIETGIGIPPPLPINTTVSTDYQNLIFFNGTPKQLNLYDAGDGYLTFLIEEGDGSVQNIDISDMLVTCKVFYRVA